ncbi:hypothetical protein N0V90_010667 [Kalmusia sp. IMI 367209]|nr:hypothetical protein N0V90_010667 [Kalmusia sp. IMI 367209]
MPADSDSKSSSESQNSPQGWLSKCFPTLSVRDRQAPNKGPVSTGELPADSSEKKRKRSSLNPTSPSKRSMGSSQQPNPAHQAGSEQPKEPFADLGPLHVSADGSVVDSNGTQVGTIINGDPEKLKGFLVDKDGKVSGTAGKASAERYDESLAYQNTRKELIDRETKGAWDYHASTNELAPHEKKTASILNYLREYERVNTFGNIASEALPGKDTLDMGGQFLTNKYRIEKQSILFEIAKQVPKGALLHLHFNAELNPERLLLEAREIPNMFVWSLTKITTKEDLNETEIMFKVLPSNIKQADFFSEDYRGTAKNDDGKLVESHKLKDADHRWMKWSDFQEKFKKHFPKMYEQPQGDKYDNGNRTESGPGVVALGPAEYWIKLKMVLSNEEAYDPAQTVNGVWARFNQATRCFKGLLNYEQVYEWYIGKAIERLIDEKVMYAELRPMLLDKTIQANNGDASVTLQDQMRMISRAVDKKKRELDKDNKGDLFPFGLKIIYCTPRSIPEKMMNNEIKDCIKLKKDFPDLICGFDLVGAEDRPNHIGFYHKQLTALQAQCKAQNIEIPFMFHAGETLLDTGGSTKPENSNLYDAVALKSKRIGHGFSLMKHPHLVEKFKRTPQNPGICIELCPISNELLHLCRNIKEHPYPELLAAGIPCCVNSDNPSLFSNSMSHEFYQVMVGSPTMSVHSWKQLALWSLEYSCLNDGEKKKAEAIFRTSWEEFCDSVVDTYGNMFQFNEDDTVQTFFEDQAKKTYNEFKCKRAKET